MSCRICPRRCGADRSGGEQGFCRSGSLAAVCRAAPHFGEEPCISGSRGSGAVFFSGCNLGCVFCQNREISRGGAGELKDAAGLRDVFLRLRDLGVHNINLVTPTHFTDVIARALEGAELDIPVVWNSSGYESVETLRRLEGLVDVYMPDLKYSSSALAAKYSAAPDYPEVALAAIKEMYRQTGPCALDGEGIMTRGLLVRHLILPGSVENSLGVIDMVEENLPVEDIYFSLMSQYTPMPGLEDFPELQRPLSREEYERCAGYLELSGIENGYYQDLGSAGEDFIPAFDGTGV